MAGYPGTTGSLHALLAWPALWSVPLGFVTMVLVSLATATRVPAGTAAILARFHLPEELTDGQVRAAVSGTASAAAGAKEAGL
jgi:hypothetical protein